MTAGGYTVSDLAQVIPVFPLDGALLLPHGKLPLNIFEPRYLNMIDDAMAGDRIIGMVQTAGEASGDPERPALAGVGCAGRITSYAETGDGRYLITLTGVCRFRLGPELPVQTPYRQVRAAFAAFEQDLTPVAEEDPTARPALLGALKAYLDHRGLDVDWRMARETPLEALVNSLAMALPFDAAEKQALLEADTFDARRAALTALLRIDAAGGDDDKPPHLQ
jgi:Lon protease-like protein